MQNFNVPQISIKPFGGSTTDNYLQFEARLQSSLELSDIAADRRARVFHLHLKDGALQFFDQLPEDTKANFNEVLRRFRQRYASTANTETHKLALKERKFNIDKESIEDYLLDIKRLALLA